MKKVVKINFMLVLAAMFTFGFMSFKMISSADEEQQWHTITFNDPDDESDDVIGAAIDEPGDESEECSTVTDEYRCAIQLTYDPMLYNPQGKTVSQAESSPLVTDVGPRAFREETN